MKPGKSDSFPPQPPRERGTTRAFTLALLMHVLLGLFLYHGIHWQNSTPAGAEAELWTDIPQQQTPPAPAPPVRVAPPAPPVRDEQADIALQEKKRQQQEAAARAALLAEQERQRQLAEQEAQAKRQRELQQQAELAAQKAADKLKKQQAEKLRQQQLAEQQKQEQLKQKKEDELKQQQLEAQKKAEAEKAAKAKALAQQQQQAKQKLDQERRARLAQLQGLAGESSTGNGLAKSGAGTGSGGTAASPGYADKVKRRVRPNIVWAGETEGLETVIAVHCSPTGTLLSATVTRGSGNAQWDDAALRAVQRSDPMPLDDNGRAPASFTITIRPAG